MEIVKILLNDILLIKPKIKIEERIVTKIISNEELIRIGIDMPFLQENEAFSYENVLRGLHFQIKHPQGKLISVFSGSIFDTVVDLRQSSSSYGKTASFELSQENGLIAWIPPGYAHGYYVLSNEAKFTYKVTDYRYEQYERVLLWNDKDLKIKWPNQCKDPVLSEKDQNGTPFEIIEKY